MRGNRHTIPEASHFVLISFLVGCITSLPGTRLRRLDNKGE
jgi:hypothetical protein